MSKHTLGPWKLCHHLESIEKDKSCGCGYRGGIWSGCGEFIVCEIGGSLCPNTGEKYFPEVEREQQISDAHLIAAAPELYELLLEILDKEKCVIYSNAIGKVRTGSVCFQDWELRARAAIAKATGEKT